MQLTDTNPPASEKQNTVPSKSNAPFPNYSGSLQVSETLTKSLKALVDEIAAVKAGWLHSWVIWAMSVGISLDDCHLVEFVEAPKRCHFVFPGVTAKIDGTGHAPWFCFEGATITCQMPPGYGNPLASVS